MATDTIALCTAQSEMRTAADMPDIDYAGSPAMAYLAYDEGTDQTGYWLCCMPEGYGSGGLTVKVAWTHLSTSGNNFGAEVGFARLQADTTDIDSLSFAANNTGTWAHNGTDGGWNTDTITFTNGADMGSIAAGELFVVRLVRNTSVGSDLAGDVLVAGMAIRET
jgi:hypothetical protein